MNPVPSIRTRSPGKFASTTYVNEVANALIGSPDFGPSGQPVPIRHNFPNVVVTISGEGSGDGSYTGDIMGGEMSGDDASDFAFPQGMGPDDTPCVIFSGTESGRGGHRLGAGQNFPGFVVGHTDDDQAMPIVLIRPDIVSDKRVRLEKVGGTDGDDTTPPSYTYDVFDYDDAQLNTAPVTPLMVRANGSFEPAELGIGREQAESPGFALAWVNEPENTDNCETTSLAEFYSY